MGHDGDHGGVPGYVRRRLADQMAQHESIGQFQAGQRLQDTHQLFGAASCFDDHRLQAIAVLAHAGTPMRRLPRASLDPPTLLPDPVRRVAAVGHQSHLSVHLVQSIGDGGGRGDRQLTAIRLVVLGVRRLVEIKQHCHAGNGRRLQDFAVQCAGSCGGSPVDTIEWVARVVGAYAGDAGGVFVQAIGHAHLSDRTFGGDVVSVQWYHSGQDHQKVRRRDNAIAPMQAEQIAGLQYERADLPVAPAIALHLIHHGCPSSRCQPGQFQATARDAQIGRVVDQRPPRQEVLHQHPGHRQPRRVFHAQDDCDFVADLCHGPAGFPLRAQGVNPCLGQQSAGKHHAQQRVHGIGHQPQVEGQCQQQQQNGSDDPFHGAREELGNVGTGTSATMSRTT